MEQRRKTRGRKLKSTGTLKNPEKFGNYEGKVGTTNRAKPEQHEANTKKSRSSACSREDGVPEGRHGSGSDMSSGPGAVATASGTMSGDKGWKCNEAKSAGGTEGMARRRSREWRLVWILLESILFESV